MEVDPISMSLDDIIDIEERRKDTIRVRNSSEDNRSSRSSSPGFLEVSDGPLVQMLPPFPDNEPGPQRNRFRRNFVLPPGEMKQRNWAGMGGRGRPYNQGNRNFQPMWKQRSGGRRFNQRYFGHSNQLTCSNLNQFNEQFQFTPRRRGPGSVGSRGSRASSICSRCSHSSYRSNSSFRSNRSGRSFRSSNSCSNGPQCGHKFRRFGYKLNLEAQREMKYIQEQKEERIKNTARENLIDDISTFKPIPKSTGISLNHRFKKFILNYFEDE